MRNDMATITALLFDLDETLVADEASTEEALQATCLLAQQRHGLDPQVLTCAVRQQARSLWQAAPTIGYCRAVGISSVEGLRARFLGDDPCLASLRAWAATYRYEAWSSALAVLGVQDGPLAERLAARFVEERGARHTVFADVVPALTILKRTYALAIVTNGSPELQRAKIRGAHLAPYFDAIVVSGEIGVGKPEPQPFIHALALLGVAATAAVMVGDSLERDIAGAQRAGIRAVWLDRYESMTGTEHRVPQARIVGLHQLRSLL